MLDMHSQGASVEVPLKVRDKSRFRWKVLMVRPFARPESLQHLAAISIDLDSERCYRQIHGLNPRKNDPDPIYDSAIPRFLELMQKLRLKATLFVIGEDLEDPTKRTLIQQAKNEGHEIANHSYAHDYALSRLTADKMRADIERAHQLIRDTVQVPPVGFRAPGYNQSETMFDVLEALGYAYDSSFFPTPAYFALRASAMWFYQIKGRKSHSLMGDVREFLTTREPFFPRQGKRHQVAHHSQSGRKILEIPISVAGPARLPWLGTSLALSPDGLGVWTTQIVLEQDSPAVLELHAIDFASSDDGFDAALIQAQKDLQVSLAIKMNRLQQNIEKIADQREVVPLQDLAQRVKSAAFSSAPDMGAAQPA